ncbi:carbohydrate ABC transporter permease [Paenibacillus eucommiae]|uniref:Multiple sugar transport system permease protein n=1 Tax=Paenibacillus eucommiae TaxID=1355755 RepID=A0ABS4IWW0_9BACL|nr:sugar ABC transporter permease [Paenibacillus eucommiae]MBP1992077.1 multiple sugar transport system permease protein [Paenibacillus eucommiae]
MNRTWGQLSAYLFILPSMICFIIFVLVPAVMGLGLSFFQWDLTSPIRYVGLDNWADFMKNKEAIASIRTTLLFVIISIPLTIAFGLLLALLVNKLPFGKPVFRSIFFIPAVTSMVAMSVIWGNMYTKDTGLINYMLSLFGISPVGWLSGSFTAIIAVIMFSLWHSAGYNMLIFLAGLQSIDETLYEAAKVDGASPFYVFRKVTLPLLSPTMFFIVITSVIGNLQTFEAVYLLTEGGPGYATTTLVYFIVNAAFKGFNMGLAATISTVLFALIAIVTLIQWKFQERWVHYN